MLGSNSPRACGSKLQKTNKQQQNPLSAGPVPQLGGEGPSDGVPARNPVAPPLSPAAFSFAALKVTAALGDRVPGQRKMGLDGSRIFGVVQGRQPPGLPRPGALPELAASVGSRAARLARGGARRAPRRGDLPRAHAAILPPLARSQNGLPDPRRGPLRSLGAGRGDTALPRLLLPAAPGVGCARAGRAPGSSSPGVAYFCRPGEDLGLEV